MPNGGASVAVFWHSCRLPCRVGCASARCRDAITGHPGCKPPPSRRYLVDAPFLAFVVALLVTLVVLRRQLRRQIRRNELSMTYVPW